MLTMVAVIGLVVVVGGIGLVLGLSPEETPEPAAVVKEVERPSAFFVVEDKREERMEILLARLEQHVRQERAAVETFHDEPSTASLRSRTSSPLAN